MSTRSGLRCSGTLALSLLLGAAMPAEADWSRFRGPNGTGIVPEAGYPTAFGPDRNLKWRAAVRPGKSSPVLSRRHVFLTAFDDGTLYTQCFDRQTGRLAWERSEKPARREDAHELNEPAAASPVTDGENVYVFFRDLGVVSYDARGKVRWRREMGSFENLVDAGPLCATGRPAQIVTAGGGRFGGHAADNGARLWTHDGMASAMVASPVVNGDTVVGFGYGSDGVPPFANGLKRNDRDGDGRISVEECGVSGRRRWSSTDWSTQSRTAASSRY